MLHAAASRLQLGRCMAPLARGSRRGVHLDGVWWLTVFLQQGVSWQSLERILPGGPKLLNQRLTILTCPDVFGLFCSYTWPHCFQLSCAALLQSFKATSITEPGSRVNDPEAKVQLMLVTRSFNHPRKPGDLAASGIPAPSAFSAANVRPRTRGFALDAVSVGFLMMLALWEKDVRAEQSLAAAMETPFANLRPAEIAEFECRGCCSKQ